MTAGDEETEVIAPGVVTNGPATAGGIVTGISPDVMMATGDTGIVQLQMVVAEGITPLLHQLQGTPRTFALSMLVRGSKQRAQLRRKYLTLNPDPTPTRMLTILVEFPHSGKMDFDPLTMTGLVPQIYLYLPVTQ